MDIEKIIEDINIININDERVLVWYCGLFTEYLVKKMFAKLKSNSFIKCNTCGKSSEPSFKTKVDELVKDGYINTEVSHDSAIKAIWDCRNLASHEITLDLSRINKAVEEYTKNSKKYDPDGLIEKVLGNISWKRKLQMITIAIVYSLDSTLKTCLGETQNKKLTFEIDPGCTQIQPRLV